MAETNQQSLEQQIAALQNQLDVARAQSGRDSSTPYERAEVHSALGEQIKQQMPAYQPAPGASSGATDVPAYQDPNLVQQVQGLVNVAFTQSVQAAIDQAMKSGNPAVLDALHDVLADQLHDELIKRQKIDPAV